MNDSGSYASPSTDGIRLWVSLFRNRAEARPIKTGPTPWATWVDSLCEKGVGKGKRPDVTKLDLPLWQPVKLKEGASRGLKAIEGVYALGLDYDGGSSLALVEEVWNDWGCLIHTTPSHRVEYPKCRVFVPFTRPVTVEEYYRIWAWAYARSSDAGAQPDKQCKDPSRAWFVPTIATAAYSWKSTEGFCLDVDEVLKGSYSGAPLGAEPLDGDMPVSHESGIVMVRKWARKARPGEKLKCYCPLAQGETSFGAAFLRRRRTGVLLVCTSHNHGHFETPAKWWWEEETRTTKIARDPGILDKLDWKLDKEGKRKWPPQKTINNLHVILEEDVRWKGRLWFDVLRAVDMIDDAPMSDADETGLRRWLEQAYALNYASSDITSVVSALCRARVRNPLAEQLRAMTWDGVSRAEDWLIRGLGVEDIPLHREMGKRWLIQAVARGLHPGAKTDAVLVLVGPQGVFKSTAMRRLAGDEWFSDTPLNLSNKDAYMQLRAAWIYEIAELEGFRGRDRTTIKAFLSAQDDTFRLPYGKRAERHDRHTVFCATTNDEEFLSDPTGSRRFWPVKVGKVDLEWLGENRENLWAEAVALYSQGEPWWLSGKGESERGVMAESFTAQDAWAELVETWLIAGGAPNTVATFTVRDLMEHALDLKPEKMGRREQMRVADVLKKMGATQAGRKQQKGKVRRLWRWTRPEGAQVIRVDFEEKGG